MVVVTAYYAYVGVTYYRREWQTALYRLIGKKPVESNPAGGDVPIPVYNVAGAIKEEEVEYVAQTELTFGPPDDEAESGNAPDIHLLGEFSEMSSEVKTLITVINESRESKENFEMLFRLIVQKYPALVGTGYEKQVNDYLLNEGAGQFPFSLDLNELQTFWRNDDEKN